MNKRSWPPDSGSTKSSFKQKPSSSKNGNKLPTSKSDKIIPEQSKPSGPFLIYCKLRDKQLIMNFFYENRRIPETSSVHFK